MPVEEDVLESFGSEGLRAGAENKGLAAKVKGVAV